MQGYWSGTEKVLRNEERMLKLAKKVPEKAHGTGLTGWVSWVEVETAQAMAIGTGD